MSWKAFGVVPVKYKAVIRPNRDRCMAHNEESCELLQFFMDDKYVFVHYYDIIVENAVENDAIDHNRNCTTIDFFIYVTNQIYVILIQLP